MAGVGFIADYGKDGFSTGSPAYAGDYFLPGSPLEGWQVEYTTPSGFSRFVNKGLSGSHDIPTSSLSGASLSHPRLYLLLLLPCVFCLPEAVRRACHTVVPIALSCLSHHRGSRSVAGTCSSHQ